jgi:hypothetical protein
MAVLPSVIKHGKLENGGKVWGNPSDIEVLMRKSWDSYNI